MGFVKYSPDLKKQCLQLLKETGSFATVSAKFNVPEHAIRRFKRESLASPQVSKDKEIKQLNKELHEKDLEIQILRELLKKTYQVMPIESKHLKS